MIDSTIHNISLFQDSPLTLSSGETLRDISIAYQAHGTLNSDKTNVILVCHPLTADAHVAGLSDASNPKSTGWWDQVIGPGKTICTNTHYVICTSSLGSCKGSTGLLSINPKTQEPYGLEFPVITISDMVDCQKALLDHLGISTLKMVIGGSMGGMALEWVCKYPDHVRSCVPIAATAQVSPQTIAFDAVGRHAIRSDHDFHSETTNQEHPSQKRTFLSTHDWTYHLSF